LLGLQEIKEEILLPHDSEALYRTLGTDLADAGAAKVCRYRENCGLVIQN
jgi:hypothetical protein